jgi:hypothetical protein
MHWSVTLIIAAALGANTPQQATQQFDSYSKAYWAASEAHRPMLVILTDGNSEQAVPLAALQQDETSRDILDDYVVAVIDTNTEHGRTVHELFGAPALPRTVVIDQQQKKQIFRTSDTLRPETLTSVLKQYRDGTPVTVIARRPVAQPAVQGSLNYYQGGAGNCPNCRKF